jgi:hypothetical protein
MRFFPALAADISLSSFFVIEECDCLMPRLASPSSEIATSDASRVRRCPLF